MKKTVLFTVFAGGMAFGLFGVDLPSNAVAIEYIEGDGNSAYMNTGWMVNPQTDTIQVEFAVVNENVNETLWCARGSNTDDRAFSVFLMGANRNVRWDYNSSVTSVGGLRPLKAGVKYTLTASGGSMEIDNMFRYDNAVSASFTQAGGPLYLFCSYFSGNMDNRSNFGTSRLYSLKYWRSGELIHDCIPFRNLQGSDVGLWDRVEGKGLTRTFTFTAGPDGASDLSIRLPDQEAEGTCEELEPRLEVRNANGRLLTPGEDYTVDYVPGSAEGMMRAHVTCLQGSGAFGTTNVDYSVRRPVPSTYERLAYIQGDGASWLLTDYVPNPQTDVLSLTYALTNVETTAFLCSRANNGTSSWSFCTIGSQYRFDYQQALTPVTPASRILVDTKYVVTLSNNVAQVNAGFKKTVSLNTGLTSTVNPLMFYAFYVSGPNSGNRNTISKHKTYIAQAWRSGVLIHEWVPVRRVADGVATLYDTIAQSEVAPLGTGAFIAGPVLPSTEKAVTVADISVQELAGTPCTPALDVRDACDGTSLVAGTDYTVAYADNAAAGVATATVTGLGSYAGFSVAVPFTILHPLPSGYERLAYIQGDGASYFLTDWIVHPREDRLDADIELTVEKVNAALWCARSRSAFDSFTLFQLAAGTFRWDYATGNLLTFSQGAGIQKGVRYAIRATNRGELYWGDRACAAHRKNVTANAPSHELALFASYDSDTNSVSFVSTHRLYGLSIRRDGEPARTWVPVKDAAGVATLYDVATGTRLASRGTGAFIAGPKKPDFDLYVRDQAWNGQKRIRPLVAATNRVTGAELVSGSDFLTVVSTDTSAGIGLVTATGMTGSTYEGQAASTSFAIHAALPEGYTRLRSVQGDGSAYLMTDITPNPSTDRMKVEFELPKAVMSGLFCARQASIKTSWSLCVMPTVSRFRFDYGGTEQAGTCGPILSNHRYVADVNGKTFTASSGEILTSTNSTLTATGGPLAILAYYKMVNGEPSVNSCSRARIFGVQMLRSGTVIHNWVPVLTPDGVATLFDLVDQTALVPQGGSLIAGPIVEYDPLPPAGTILIVR